MQTNPTRPCVSELCTSHGGLISLRRPAPCASTFGRCRAGHLGWMARKLQIATCLRCAHPAAWAAPAVDAPEPDQAYRSPC